MITNPPTKKGFHFAATAEYLAEYIEAETIQEAEAIYHQIKKAVGGNGKETVSPETVTEPTAPVQEPAPAVTPEPAPTPQQPISPVDEQIKQ